LFDTLILLVVIVPSVVSAFALKNTGCGVLPGIIRHPNPQQHDKQTLHTEAKPIHCAPGAHFAERAAIGLRDRSQETRRDASDEHAEGRARSHDGYTGAAALGRREIADQRKQELRRNVVQTREKGGGAEDEERSCHAKGDPLHGNVSLHSSSTRPDEDRNGDETYDQGGKGHEPENKRPPRQDVTKRADTPHAGSITGLHEGDDQGRSLKADVKGDGHAVEDGLSIVEVGDGYAGGLRNGTVS
jgi:hypothetical protein